MRDIKELENQGVKIIRNHERADLTVSEVMQLKEMLTSGNDTGAIDIIYTAPFLLCSTLNTIALMCQTI